MADEEKKVDKAPEEVNDQITDAVVDDVTDIRKPLLEGQADDESADDQPAIKIHDEVSERHKAEPPAAPVAAVADSAAHSAAHDPLSDTVSILGMNLTVPGGIYTVVFGALGVATLVEVLLAEIERGPLTIPLMISLALVKAILVVMFYMHLRTDSRLFTYVLVIPVMVALAATLFLLAVPVTGY